MQVEQLGEQFLTWLLGMLPKLLAAAAIVVAGWLLSRLARKLFEKAMEKSNHIRSILHRHSTATG